MTKSKKWVFRVNPIDFIDGYIFELTDFKKSNLAKFESEDEFYDEGYRRNEE